MGNCQLALSRVVRSLCWCDGAMYVVEGGVIECTPYWRGGINPVWRDTKKRLVVEEPALVVFGFEKVGELYHTYILLL